MIDPAQSNRYHDAEHAGAACDNPLQPTASDLIRVGSRRWFLQTGLTGLAGLSLPALLQSRARATTAGGTARKTSVILFWLSGGPSHIDTWDPKPDAPGEIRGPFGTIDTKVPGLRVCEHLPLQASIMDRLTLIRSVDCRESRDHHPATMQSGNTLSQSPTFADGGRHPSMGSLAARFRGPNQPGMPAFVGLADAGNSWKADVWGAGPLGPAYQPVDGGEFAGRLALPPGVNVARANDRAALLAQFDRLQRALDAGDTMASMDNYSREALSMVLAGKARQAFQIDQEPDRVRNFYGRNTLGERALLARRLVEAGVTFVVVSGFFGLFDNHGDNVIWGGLIKGLKPLLPRIDRAVYALVNDLEARGLLDSTLILMMGEFGRTPTITATGGREHYLTCMSMLVAGGGLAHGQAIGSTDRTASEIKTGRVTPSDLGATVFRHLGIDLDAHWTDPAGRPHPIVTEGGRPIPGLGG